MSQLTSESSDLETGTAQRGRWLSPWWIVAAAIIMGLPALMGGFVGGDDRRLVLDHVLVNHPSIEHAIELFRIVHRDLYQPLPLLTFQGEFALAKALGFFPKGVESFAWLFHLTNILLHAVNSLLVFHILWRLHTYLSRWKIPESDDLSARWVAFAAALLFALHPLQVEAVAWVNGRMMLLSTLFALGTMYAFLLWLDRPRIILAFIAPAFALLSGISKVRSGLPLLLLIPLLLRRKRPDGKTLLLWGACSIVTAFFMGLNVWTTASADLFAEGAEHLKGPRLARVLLALAWYVRHFLWPSGLTSYHPTPHQVYFLSTDTLRALVIVLAAGLAFLFIARRLRSTWWGVAWFALAIGDTLPFFPARNVVAAERYMYLPIIGILWICGEAVDRWRLRREGSVAQRRSLWPIALATAALIAIYLVTSWRFAVTWNDSLAKTGRVAEVYPDEPHVWEHLGWSYHARGFYKEAFDCGQKELRHSDTKVQSGAYQLMGSSQINMGNIDEGLKLMHKALELEPTDTLALFRLGMALEKMGRETEAISFYERAVDTAPRSNPTMQRLARLYVTHHRNTDARKLFERQLENNPYEVPATLGLAELDIADATLPSLESAAQRLRGLLEWMPENPVARANLGVALSALGKKKEAIEQYTTALTHDPTNATAAVNLAQLHLAAGKVNESRAAFIQAASSSNLSLDQAVVVHDALVDFGAVEQLAPMWERFIVHNGNSCTAEVLRAWGHAFVGKPDHALRASIEICPPGSSQLVALRGFANLVSGQFQSATEQIESEALMTSEQIAKAQRHRLLAALQFFDTQHADSAWAVCLAVPLLIADGEGEPAKFFMKLCEERCKNDEACAYAARLKQKFAEQR